MAFTAVLDACVLYPAPLRDLLMQLARTRLYRARWTEAIHDEWTRNVAQKRPDLVDRLARTRALMNEAIEDCLVVGYEALISGLTLPDPDDRHVLAAAIVARADVIVTLNLKDFPASAVSPFGIEVQHPDVFIRHALDLDPAIALGAVRAVRGRLQKPPASPQDMLDTLARQGLAETVAFLRDWKELF
ncbi:PIN domain-containing protein [Tanticharoenia sakaeratensis]|uniref:Uncharacterized protein n=1 Tax=Tanticharoenia sakaeratensis NBRC 103193 TaxID=1231623 RepID=A0A0D6MI34_9PROT|nr:PIN domain-containing protein [Tanticharoenia sakaeratensis]GAN53171.1 hypothetical protein Tasa_007_016 [Tanticharoenia sakaeratensis NBRC 103193]GBQ23925.1 hypothetical protein AA103193_2575 [Tanticharoenia sakaeratensis NBRC 103193]